MNALGRHILAEFYECDTDILNDAQRIENYMKRAALECGATIVSSTFQTFNPHGVSGVIVIAESHLAIHTWPEYGYAAVDVFTSLLPGGVTKFLLALWEITLAAVLILITVQLFDGMMDKYNNGQTTFLLQYPVWWAYGASFIAAIATSLVGIYCAAARVLEGISGRAILPGSGGAMH